MFSVSCETIDAALELARKARAEPDRLAELIGHLQKLRDCLEHRLVVDRYEALSDLEKAEFLYRESENLARIAQILQISERRIYQLLRLVRLPQEHRKVIREERLSERQVRPFLNLTEDRLLESLVVVGRFKLRPSKTEALAELVREKSSDNVEELAKKYLERRSGR